MSSFKDFAKLSLQTDPQLLSEARKNFDLAVKKTFDAIDARALTSANVGSLAIETKHSEAESFSRQVATYLGSDQFFDEIDKRVGSPKADETEEEYLSRAKEVFIGLLGGTTEE